MKTFDQGNKWHVGSNCFKNRLDYNPKTPQRAFAGSRWSTTSHPYKSDRSSIIRFVEKATHIIHNVRHFVIRCSAKKVQSRCYSKAHREKYPRTPYSHAPGERWVDRPTSNHNASQWAGHDRSDNGDCLSVQRSVAFYVRKILNVNGR